MWAENRERRGVDWYRVEDSCPRLWEKTKWTKRSIKRANIEQLIGQISTRYTTDTTVYTPEEAEAEINSFPLSFRFGAHRQITWFINREIFMKIKQNRVWSSGPEFNPSQWLACILSTVTTSVLSDILQRRVTHYCVVKDLKLQQTEITMSSRFCSNSEENASELYMNDLPWRVTTNNEIYLGKLICEKIIFMGWVIHDSDVKEYNL